MEIRTWHARHNKNITLKQLQDLTGITKTALNDIENGKKSPTLDQLEKIAKALNVRITDLFISKYK
ncbi:helix-turn-helix domain-containing protein [Anaerostipes caccae]|uniref:Helix-turn-helix XRE-family like protein n=1 Tax=Siphoviridae sp. ctXmm2 TaxID=2825546 RepID=A0A8S5QI80_9CAUD|nr:helix-turn-helix transcriptional regulator [Anaerostipes caccae]DAE18698.1 MAG TPA: Helix-turn-helix XRE-family like protein [Siphoviridae sp. ctXmm2]